MCGIVGIYNYKNGKSVSKDNLLKMRDTLIHRGPDDAGIMVDGNVGLAHRRLSIIDLSKNGRQPMSNTDGTVWITYGGEFYNFNNYKQELLSKGYDFRSRTDTEVILYLYQEYGIEETLQRINGMFSFAIWDKNIRTLFVCRDRLGIKPLFYATINGAFVFASEIKAILEYDNVPKNINKQVIYDYFSLKVIPSPDTVFKNIHKLDPGHYLVLSDGKLNCKEYWDLEIKNNGANHNKLEVIDNLLGHLKRSVKAMMISDVPIGAFLSGGVDSSSIVVAMSQISEEVRTYSISLSEYTKYDETFYAKTVSEKFDTRHSNFDLKAELFDTFSHCMEIFDEPFAISSAFALYYLSKLSKEEVSVVLSGDGGDEIFAGYSTKYYRDKILSDLEWIPKFLPRYGAQFIEQLRPDTKENSILFKIRKYLGYLACPKDIAYVDSISTYREPEKRLLFSDYFFENTEIKPTIHVFDRYYSKKEFKDNLQRRLYGEIKTRLHDEMLTKVDRMTMASSLESRVPLLDHKLVEYAFNIDSKLKLQGRNKGKMIFKEAMEKYLPMDILYRRKSGFSIPIDFWLKNQLKDLVDQTLSEKELKKHGFFNIDFVKRLIECQRKDLPFGMHSALYNNIFLLVVFQIWFNKFIYNN